jgi:polyphosphate kinase
LNGIGQGKRQRNLESRVEICTPVEKPKLKKLLREMFDHQLNNQRNAWEVQADGSYSQRFAKAREGSVCIHRKLIERAEKRLAAGGRGVLKKKTRKKISKG